MQVKDALKLAYDQLTNFLEKERAKWEAILIVSHLLKVSPLNVYLYPEAELNEDELWKVLKKRSAREPLAYIFGEAYFWGRKFLVEKGVLIPRPETELLIEVFLNSYSKDDGKFLDVGIGSGVIGITLLIEKPKAKVFGVDISDKAIEVSLKNARLYGVRSRYFILKGDWLTPFKKGAFDVVLSNPPYISNDEYFTLERDVRDFEPKEALLAGEKGLDFCEKLLKHGDEILKPGGFLIFEIGYNQYQEVKNLLKLFNWNFQFFKDLSGHYRVVKAWREST